VKNIADYGGGFGELALAITSKNSITQVTIIEPYPSDICIQRIQGRNNIKLKDILLSDFDAIVAQDVLEHVEDPLGLAIHLVDNVKQDGLVIFANCFHPVVKCHLPKTFHFRHTFPWVMNALGLKFIGRIEGAQHAQVFKKVHNTDLVSARRAELVSKYIGPTLNAIYSFLSTIRKQLIKVS
jgi:2-polyprenyl-6-hydroxyphenyl methylase/3-demethylubiquinone-9 3-methyltransferase